MARRTSLPAFTSADVAQWQPSKINSMLDRISRLDSDLTDRFIAAGRGHERPTETWHKDDPLALEYRHLSGLRGILHNEIAMRYGPGAPSRLPRGFGPRKVLW